MSHGKSQVINNNGSVATTLVITGTGVHVTSAGVMAVGLVNNGGTVTNFGSVVAGAYYPYDIKTIGTDNTAGLIVLR